MERTAEMTRRAARTGSWPRKSRRRSRIGKLSITTRGATLQSLTRQSEVTQSELLTGVSGNSPSALCCGN